MYQWDTDFDEDFYSENDIKRRIRNSFSTQFSLAAWFLRIVQDVDMNFVNFKERSDQLGLKLPWDAEKYMYDTIAIEMISKKFGTLHIFGPGGFEIQRDKRDSFWIINTHKNEFKTHFDRVKNIANNLTDVFEGKYFGDIWQMEQLGYIQDKYIDLTDARYLESISILLETWARSFEGLNEESSDLFLGHAYLSIDFENPNRLWGKIYFPFQSEEHHCICLSPSSPYIQLIDGLNSDSQAIFMNNMMQALQNPNRP